MSIGGRSKHGIRQLLVQISQSLGCGQSGLAGSNCAPQFRASRSEVLIALARPVAQACAACFGKPIQPRLRFLAKAFFSQLANDAPTFGSGFRQLSGNFGLSPQLFGETLIMKRLKP